LYRPVRWNESIKAMQASGARMFAEVGPGRVLTGLMRRIDRSLEAMSLHDEVSLDSGLSRMESGEEK
jgi:[acyl-carrier-protein] S-malonyltransferase